MNAINNYIVLASPNLLLPSSLSTNLYGFIPINLASEILFNQNHLQFNDYFTVGFCFHKFCRSLEYTDTI